jgi:hypothetical protein
MTQNRDGWVRDIIGDEVPVLPAKEILDLVSIHFSLEDASRVGRQLELTGDLLEGTQSSGNDGVDSRWKNFSTKPSLTLKDTDSAQRDRGNAPGAAQSSNRAKVATEDVIFKRLEAVIASIKNAGASVLKRPSRTTFRADPGRKFVSADENATFRVDGYDYLDKTTFPNDVARSKGHVNECDAVYVFEAKKFKDEQRLYDVRPLYHSAIFIFILSLTLGILERL